MSKRVYEIDGESFDTLDGFFDAVGREVLGGTPWGRNFDAFNDILRGGFGTPEEGFVFRWRSSERSRSALGHSATIQYLEKNIVLCHPTSVDAVRADLESARRGEGQTVFEILVDIIRAHGRGGEDEADGVELELA